jgi:hypothetical protein
MSRAIHFMTAGDRSRRDAPLLVGLLEKIKAWPQLRISSYFRRGLMQENRRWLKAGKSLRFDPRHR